jgi:uracil DNA glycosylase
LKQVTDRWGNRITLTDERWQHIIEWHPELEGFENDVLDTIRKGRRRQDPIDPHKYKYFYAVEDLPFGLTHIVVVGQDSNAEVCSDSLWHRKEKRQVNEHEK